MKKIRRMFVWACLACSAAPVFAATPSQPVVATELQQQLALGESYRDSGSYELADKVFEAALTAAQTSRDRAAQAMLAAALGYNRYLARKEVQAQQSLSQALSLASQLNAPALSALIEQYLGMLYLSQQQPEQAAVQFTAALQHARAAKATELIAGIEVNQAKLPLEPMARLTALAQSSADVLKLKAGGLKINLLLSIGEQLLEIDPDLLDDQQKNQHLKATYQMLDSAYQLADTANLPRLRSQAEGYLARLYSQQSRGADALLWLDKAIQDAQQSNAPDLSLQWELHSAKLLQAKGELDAAANAYQRAIKHLEAIRYGLPIILHNGRSSIKDIIDPVYRGLADVLLQQAARTPVNVDKQVLLVAAIDALETIKKTELEDFFKDRCLTDDATAINLKEALLPDVGIIYPVLLPDRIELLFRAGDSRQIEQKAVAVDAQEVTDTATQMTTFLRHGKGNYRKASHKLYDWLFKAYESTFKAKGINQLVYVPDGILRQVPFAALLKGKRFVVEDYTIVTLPGLTLKQKPQDSTQKPRVLIAALSKPDGASIDELIKNSLVGGVGQRGLIDINTAGQLPTVASSPQVVRANLVNRLSLPGVNDEVLALQKNLLNTTLLNQSFTYQGFKEAVGTGDYSIIHVASHGYFGKNVDDSFVMNYDRNLKLGDFQALLSNENGKKKPIDLLTLSACQTAEGDDRALLGFSGIAVKTNALSAIGTLWSVDDVATAAFMDVFYNNLSRLGKAQALRQAQLALMRSSGRKHPHYWSPFILVGNG